MMFNDNPMNNYPPSVETARLTFWCLIDAVSRRFIRMTFVCVIAVVNLVFVVSPARNCGQEYVRSVDTLTQYQSSPAAYRSFLLRYRNRSLAALWVSLPAHPQNCGSFQTIAPMLHQRSASRHKASHSFTIGSIVPVHCRLSFSVTCRTSPR